MMLKRGIKFLFKLYNSLLLKFMNNTHLGAHNQISSRYIYNSKIGEHNYIGPGVIINRTIMGNFCSIAAYTQIGGMDHSIHSMSTSTVLNHPIRSGDVTLEDDVWVGAACYIKAGVTLGRGAVVGAGSVVLKDVPPYAIVAGTPARVLRFRFDDKIIKMLGEIDFTQDIDILKKLNDDFNSRRG